MPPVVVVVALACAFAAQLDLPRFVALPAVIKSARSVSTNALRSSAVTVFCAFVFLLFFDDFSNCFSA